MRKRVESNAEQRRARAGHIEHALEMAVVVEHVNPGFAGPGRIEPGDINVARVPLDGDAFGIQRARRQRGEALHAAAIPGGGIERNQKETSQQE
jgi:hypothetical protein